MRCLKSYKPISLLSILGKGLESYITKHLAVTAIEHGVISQLNFSALSVSSAVDLVQLLHMVEKALEKGLSATLFLMDVLGVLIQPNTQS